MKGVVVFNSDNERLALQNEDPSNEFIKPRAVDRKPSVYVPASDRTLNMLLIKDGLKAVDLMMGNNYKLHYKFDRCDKGPSSVESE